MESPSLDPTKELAAETLLFTGTAPAGVAPLRQVTAPTMAPAALCQLGLLTTKLLKLLPLAAVPLSTVMPGLLSKVRLIWSLAVLP